MKTLEEKIAVMRHYLNGGDITYNGRIWEYDEEIQPCFNWEDNDYFIYEEPNTKPSIDWSHVSKEYKWLAVGEDGSAYLYMKEPKISKELEMWQYGGGATRAEVFASFNPGNCDWKDSLVQHPK